MLNGAIYARSSLGKERQGDTVEHQVEMIKEFVKRMKMDVVFNERFIYIDDGESGFKTTLLQRPAMRSMLKDIDGGLIDVVFFKGISRFARDSGETITTTKRLINKGVRVISLEENYDSSRDDPTLFQIYAVMAEQESRKTSIRVSLGNKQKARNGVWAGSNTPIGYTKVKDIEDPELKKKLLGEGKHPESLYPDDNAIIVQRVFEMYVKENKGRKKIASWLNENGYRTVKDALFQESFIKDILSNEVYIGNIVYGKTRYVYIEDEETNRKIQRMVHLPESEWVRVKNAHPAIVDKELFEAAQHKLKTMAKQHKHRRGLNAAKHPLTGILKCGLCGGVMICQKRTNKRKDGTKRSYRYYVCSTYHKMGRHVCPQANVNADDLEEELMQVLMEKVREYSNFNVTERVQEKDNKRQKIKKDIDRMDLMITKKIEASKALLETRTLYDTETFIMLNKEIQDEIKQLRSQKEMLENSLKELGDKRDELKLQELYEKYTKEGFNDIKERRELFHFLLDSVIIENSEVKEINFDTALPL